ncbi:MAG: AEC family transporter [Clostridia bacterium]|nr:AEC family transporter [Clostridia bacterium]
MTVGIGALIPTALCLFLLIVTGFSARKLRLVDDTVTKGLSVIVAKVAQPFLIIYSIVKLDYSALNLKNGLIVLGFGILLHALMALVGMLVFSRVRDIDEKKIYVFALTFCNCAFVGFPIIESLFGQIGLFYGAFYVVSYNIGAWSFGVWLMSRGKQGARVTARRILVNAGTVPCAIGLLLYVLQIPLPDFLMTAMNTLGSLCTPLSLIVTGSLIAAMPLKHLFFNGKFYAYLSLKLVALPLACACLFRVCGIGALIGDIHLGIFLTVMTALPPAALTTLFANIHDVKPSYAAQLVSLGTFLSPMTILLVMKLSELIF